MAISDQFLAELKYKSDIEQIISSYVTLKRAGRNLTGLCPFHSEKTPSFTVYPENQSFYCFGCGAGGDVVSFIKRIENLDYLEALKFLADRAGMRLPVDGQDEAALKVRAKVLEMNREAARFYYHMLTGDQGKGALAYLHGRGLTDKTITRFGLGYARDNWDDLLRHLQQKGFTPEEIISANLASRSQKGGAYDQFRNRIIFPIIDIRGNVVAFGGRNLGESGPKYLNSSETPVYNKSRNLYALNIAKATKEKRFILAEGYMDVVAIHQGGFDNAVASLGTALTSEQARMIASYTGEIVVSYDADEAGQKATKRAIGILEQAGLTVRVLKVEGAKDPDEFIKKYGSARFRMLLDGSSGATEYALSKLKTKYNLELPDGRVGYLKEACGLLASLKSPVERDVYAGRLSAQLNVQKQAIEEQVKGFIERDKRAADKKQRRDVRVMSAVASGPDNVNPQRQANLKAAVAEENLIAMLFKHPDYIGTIEERLTAEDFVTDFNKSVYERMLDKLHAGGECSLMALSPFFTDAQMSRISWMISQAAVKSYSKSDAEAYADTLLQCRHEKSPEQVAKLSGKELEDYVKSLQAKKR
ncbi:DNA primase [Acetanaerobacterium elongatum]|uniref:DNA primase n=1 Tax=Acetanaerobacterium elongatum TaxID=258515 RepID=A0A1G9WIA7_9FIRM|nr:DNA primase [Acetanaerobacterium elongatum]SDM84199.1 DNA primase [Acetanaerobacterium elongatum]